MSFKYLEGEILRIFKVASKQQATEKNDIKWKWMSNRQNFSSTSRKIESIIHWNSRLLHPLFFKDPHIFLISEVNY